MIASVNLLYAQTNDNVNIKSNRKSPAVNPDYNAFKKKSNQKYLQQYPKATPQVKATNKKSGGENLNLFEDKKAEPIIDNASLEPQDEPNSGFNNSKVASEEQKAQSLLNTKIIPVDFPKYTSGMSSKDYEAKVYKWFQANPGFRKNNVQSNYTK